MILYSNFSCFNIFTILIVVSVGILFSVVSVLTPDDKAKIVASPISQYLDLFLYTLVTFITLPGNGSFVCSCVGVGVGVDVGVAKDND